MENLATQKSKALANSTDIREHDSFSPNGWWILFDEGLALGCGVFACHKFDHAAIFKSLSALAFQECIPRLLMDISKLITDVASYLSEFVNTSLLVISNPAQIHIFSKSDRPVKDANAKYVLSPKIYSYCLLSIFVGVSIQQLIGYEHKSKEEISDSIVSLLVVLLVWILFISLTFLICWILRGKANYRTHLAVSLLIFSTSYFVSNILSFLVYFVFKAMDRLGDLPFTLDSNKAGIYLPIHFIILAILLNISQIKIHRLGIWSAFMLILINIALLVLLTGFSLLISPYAEYGFG